MRVQLGIGFRPRARARGRAERPDIMLPDPGARARAARRETVPFDLCSIQGQIACSWEGSFRNDLDSRCSHGGRRGARGTAP